MRATGLVFGALLAFGLPLACSSQPSQPPTDTSGSGTPSGGGGTTGGGGGSSGGAAEGGVGGQTAPDAGEDGGATNCLSGACTGCCTAANLCLSGGSNTACGLNGQPCINCTTAGGTGTCANQQCE